MDIETFIKQEFINLDNRIQEYEELTQIIKNKEISNPKFKQYRIQYFSKLNNSIPKTMGRGTERFREVRRFKKKLLNNKWKSSIFILITQWMMKIKVILVLNDLCNSLI
jgi:hypothetical protein